jgi:hypothetical protein
MRIDFPALCARFFPQLLIGLQKTDEPLSNRLMLIRYFDKNGNIRRYSVTKRQGHSGRIAGLDKLLAIAFPPPDDSLVHILVPSPNGYTQKLGVWRLRWTEDEQFLVAESDNHYFFFSQAEAATLSQILFQETK